MAVLSRLSMQFRITAGVVIGLAVIVSVLGYVAVSAVDQSRNDAMTERLIWAKAIAGHADYSLRRTTEQTSAVASQLSEDWNEPGFELGSVLGPYVNSFAGSAVALFKLNGQLVWTDVPSSAAEAASLYQEPQTAEALRETKAVLGQCGPRSTPTVCVAAPVRSAQDETVGVLVRRLDLSDPALNLLLGVDLGSTGQAELLDQNGEALAATNPQDIGSTMHASVLAGLIAERQAGVRVHHPAGYPQHIVAYAPLSLMPGWGVVVQQHTDVALAAARNLEREFLLFGALALVLAGGLAWFDVRQVVNPLRGLTSRAQKMAGGDLTTPISSERQDEIGTLARAFETMRARLKRSLEDIERRDRELEQRVEERTREVQSLNIELQRREELRGKLLEHVMVAQEEERKRIARELHDESAQVFATLLLAIQGADDALPDSPELAKAALARAKPQANRALQEIRKMILDLRPTALDDLGLMSAIRWYAESTLEPAGVAVSCRDNGDQRRLSTPLETALFRMAQEAINNVARHAHAKKTRLQVSFGDAKIVMDIQDDGDGFDQQAVVAAADSTRGLGLLGMKERAALFGGEVHIATRIGRGTRVRIEVPLEHGQDTRSAG